MSKQGIIQKCFLLFYAKIRHFLFTFKLFNDYNLFFHFISFYLWRILSWQLSLYIVFLCIGTDRATGDCLGPIIGYKLTKTYRKKLLLYGTLSHPVHAQNLSETIESIYNENPNAFIIAIDASLGSSPHIGFITLGEGPLLPGAGVSKDLPSVGDIFITGIVNFSGVLDSMLLQTTRLNIVMVLADFICTSIHYCYRRLNN